MSESVEEISSMGVGGGVLAGGLPIEGPCRKREEYLRTRGKNAEIDPSVCMMCLQLWNLGYLEYGKW